MLHQLLAVTPPLNEWTEFLKSVGIVIAAIAGLITAVFGAMNFLSSREVKKLAARSVAVSEKAQAEIVQTVNSVKDDLAINTTKTDLVVKQTNGDMERTIKRVVSEQLNEQLTKQFAAYAAKRDKDLPTMIKTAVEETSKV